MSERLSRSTTVGVTLHDVLVFSGLFSGLKMRPLGLSSGQGALCRCHMLSAAGYLIALCLPDAFK